MMDDGLEHQFPFIKPTPQDETDSTEQTRRLIIQSKSIHCAFNLLLNVEFSSVVPSDKQLTPVLECSTYLTYRPFWIESHGTNAESNDIGCWHISYVSLTPHRL